MRVKIFLLASLLTACDGMPLLTIHHLDTRNNKANPFKITAYDMNKCTILVEDLPPVAILGPELHGGYCLTKEEFAKFKIYLQTECHNRKAQVQNESSN